MLEIPAFRKNKKVSQLFQPIKGLKEKFPKENFIEGTEDYKGAVEETKRDYIKFLRQTDKVNTYFSLE
jgi:hypothetical protein